MATHVTAATAERVYPAADVDAALARKDEALRKLAEAAKALAGEYSVVRRCGCSACNALRAIKPLIKAAWKEVEG